MDEAQIGETMLANGQIADGIEHICNAVLNCDQPTYYLDILMREIPLDVFKQLCNRLKERQAEPQFTAVIGRISR